MLQTNRTSTNRTKPNRRQRHGLILLVVLGMLSLFSLLAVSYVVVSSQSRVSSLGRARVDFRGTPPDRLLNSAVNVVLRGTTDPSSSIYHHDLLGDLYGNAEQPLRLRVRRTQFGIPAIPPTGTYPPLSHGQIERPMLLANRFLRIPIVLSSFGANNERPLRDSVLQGMVPFNPLQDLPQQDDAWTGRVVTFLQGPLRGQSFRVVHYIGDPRFTNPAANPLQLAQNFSIIVDLQEASGSSINVGVTTQSIQDWINQTPTGGNDLQKQGLYLCYPDVPGNNQAGMQFSTGYELLLNAAPLNGFGYGITGNRLGQTQFHDLGPAYVGLDPAIGQMPAALQPRYALLAQGNGQLDDGQGNASVLLGDADEGYDAADYQNMWLSHRQTGATLSEQIIPSFHRAALINYIVNFKDPADYTAEELIATVRRIQRAVMRPLSVRVVTNTALGNELSNIQFTGSNAGDYTNGLTPQLDVAWTTQSDWQNVSNPQGVTGFLNWVRWLTRGPWDVDSDADGVYDGMWVDPNLPLITSREGKLLKVLASYTIESLDSRLDLNATGNLTQAAATGIYATATNNSYAVGAGQNLPQGFGYGPAETSLRHLFGPSLPVNDTVYGGFLQSRYGGRYFDYGTNVNRTETVAGTFGNDVRSQLDQRERRNIPVHGQLPGLPVSIHGRTAIGMDRLGNPLMLNANVLNLFGTNLDQATDDGYESRLTSGVYRDNPFGFSAWERIYRSGDWDRSNVPLRMDRRSFAYTDAGGVQHPVFEESKYVVTPASRHLRHLPFEAHRPIVSGFAPAIPPLSLFEAIRELYAYDPPPGIAPNTPLTYQAFQELFPFEFGRGQGFNVNRPFGNGVDDDNDGNIDEPEELLRNQLDDDGDGDIDEWDERDPTAFRQRTIAFAGNVIGQVNVVEDYTRGNGISGGNLDPAYESLGTGGPDLLVRRYHFGQQSRQLLARNLYCLAMLILPDDLYVANRSMPVSGPDRARMIAQWAVNMVDFRDADSAMTRFPYDPNPFTRANNNAPFWDPGTGNGQVVWGNEQQDAVLTESLFTHDMRVRDTAEDSTGKLTTDNNDPDDDLDQLRLPEGSGFFEIKALRTTSAATDLSAPGVSPSLYATAGTNKVLNLSGLTPVAPGVPQYPVFRIAISEPHVNLAGGAVSPLQLQQQPSNAAQRATTTYQLASSTPLNGLAWNAAAGSLTTPAPLQIDRVVLFTQAGAIPLNTTTIPDLPAGLTPAEVEGRVFTNYSGGNVLLRSGQYLVVGPRQVTYFGSRDLGPMSYNHRPNHHRIVLEDAIGTASGSTGANDDPYNNWATVYDANNDRIQNFRPAMAPVVSMIAAQDVPWNPTPGAPSPNLVNQIGLNVSAPYGDTYYTPPTDQLDSSDTASDPDNNAAGYGTLPGDAYYDFSGNGVGTFVPDQPFDARMGVPLEAWQQKSAADEPLPGTQEDWCTAFLQRLADPERPWHAAFNPYITVDWIPIDLTVFSGEDTITGAGNNFRFASRQKSGAVANVAGGYWPDLRRTFLSYGTTELGDTPAAANGAYFDRELPADANTAAASIRPTEDAPGGGGLPNHYMTLGYLNSTFGLMGETGTTTTVAGFVGAPSEMPSSLYWADRQFTNPQELMLVPLSAPGQLMQEFGAPQTGTPTQAYTLPTAGSEFTHLLNFLQAPAQRTGATAAAEFGLVAADLFDFMETAAPWVDAEDFVNPADVALGPYGNTAIQDAENEALAVLRAPYNRISRFVEPGKVNINDVSEPQVWKGVMWNATLPADRNNIAAVVPYWLELQTSRRGYTLGTGPGLIPNSNPFLHADSPTQFAGIFRSAVGASLRPATRSEPVGAPPTLDALAPLVNPVNATLLRSNSPTQAAPLFAAGSTTSTKHPLLETLPATRLQNLTTTRSNVFAVRVTLGFFEYDPLIGIGREYGEDDGTVMRHRGFYVIDRSIPVGYQEGQDLNTDNCILLRRIIE